MPEIREVLAQNVTRLLNTRPDMSRLDLSRQMKVADGTLGRIKCGTGNPNAETIEAIAKFFRVEPWQLLVKEFTPEPPPKLGGQDDIIPADLTADEKKLLTSFRALGEPERTYLVKQADTYLQARREPQKASDTQRTKKKQSVP